MSFDVVSRAGSCWWCFRGD